MIHECRYTHLTLGGRKERDSYFFIFQLTIIILINNINWQYSRNYNFLLQMCDITILSHGGRPIANKGTILLVDHALFTKSTFHL